MIYGSDDQIRFNFMFHIWLNLNFSISGHHQTNNESTSGLCCVFYHSSTYTFSLGKTPGFINSRSIIRVSSRTWAELDRKSRPHVTAAMSDWHGIKTKQVIERCKVKSCCEALTHYQFMLHSLPVGGISELTSMILKLFDMITMLCFQFTVLCHGPAVPLPHSLCSCCSPMHCSMFVLSLSVCEFARASANHLSLPAKQPAQLQPVHSSSSFSVLYISWLYFSVFATPFNLSMQYYALAKLYVCQYFPLCLLLCAHNFCTWGSYPFVISACLAQWPASLSSGWQPNSLCLSCFTINCGSALQILIVFSIKLDLLKNLLVWVLLLGPKHNST